MKHSGCTSDFAEFRNRELMKAFRDVVASKDYFDINKDFETVVNSPCSRFWVSEERATLVILSILRGSNILDAMRPTKREMFKEIYRRTMVVYNAGTDKPLRDIVFDVVNSPAEKFYMCPFYARKVLYLMKRNNRQYC